ncbi:hypothetical protein K9U39_18230 [Rhodoblastus acidophilus]|uniref:Uncharacterized protein n=1 Tax=Candidatus Rhodoblastus alkanivorans TaxID=2954117 RepID=A0ABS9Z3P1_9HYPH|nr:hypothetical protein [Candidatus Rhodoblastus alkanivorans]MCI4677438.1 hypothetical protein [Candidatus Rhodoblastus alkanivorans]MCI4681797.1 hypothetical protein [Candidatus Rhodoblastus alkanivorans]MDI4642847.1 hypothetical protein [Rhodoblastus acidophilus]
MHPFIVDHYGRGTSIGTDACIETTAPGILDHSPNSVIRQIVAGKKFFPSDHNRSLAARFQSAAGQVATHLAFLPYSSSFVF